LLESANDFELFGHRRVLTGVRRFLLFAAGWLALLTLARADKPDLLLEALNKSGGDDEYWAYTETSHEVDHKGRSDGDTIMRFDPSKPYAEQFTPLLIAGKPPTEKQRKEYRKRGTKRGEELERAAATQSASAAGPDDGSVISINGQEVVPDIEHAKIVSENAGSVSYEVPLRKTGRGGLPVEKFQLVIRVNRERRELENVTVRLLAPMRMMLVAKINIGEMQVDFAVVDPQYPPVLTRFGGNLAGTFFFVKGGETFEEKRTDFQRVKPFGDRFRVKIGPLKALPF
jgi:hypothetical protein